MNLYLVASIVVATLLLAMAVAVSQQGYSRLNLAVMSTLVAHSLWTVGSGGAVAAQTDADFWLWLHLGLSGYILIGPSMMAVATLQSKIRAKWAWPLLWLIVVASVFELVASWSGPWILSGYHRSPWGNVTEMADMSPGSRGLFSITFDLIKGGVTVAAWFAYLVWGWIHHPSRRYRITVVGLLVAAVALDAIFALCINLVWRTWGYPDPSVLMGAPALAVAYWTMLRFNRLSNETAGFGSPHIYQMAEMVAVIDADGLIRQVSRPFCQGLQTVPLDLERRRLIELLPWPELPSTLTDLSRGLATEAVLEGTLRSIPCRLVISCHRDGFGEVGSYLVKLQPLQSLDEVVLRYGISARERDVVARLVEGEGTDEIAAALFISPATVKNHLHSLYRKTQTSNRVELTALISQRPSLA